MSSPKVGDVRPPPSESSDPPPAAKKPRLGSKKKKGTKAGGKLFQPEPCSPEDVLWQDILTLVGGKEYVDVLVKEDAVELEPPFEKQEEVILDISGLSSDGV